MRKVDLVSAQDRSYTANSSVVAIAFKTTTVKYAIVINYPILLVSSFFQKKKKTLSGISLVNH